jgi:membrane protein implicated in regulation of membrane protease activity
MTGLYLFAAAAGVPLVLWFLFGGGEDGGGGDDGIAGVMLRRLPLNTIAFVAAAFGVCGLVLTAVGTGGGTTFAAAAVAGAVAGGLNAALFGYLRRSESTTEVTDEQLTGKIGRVVLPLTGERRGRIALTVAGQHIQLSALALPDAPDELVVGAAVLVVDVHDGIARVAPLDPELN